MRRLRGVLLAIGCAALPPSAAAALEPYQMVRSLQLVQDRIAGGDHAALPMQLKLLGMIDTRLKQTQPGEFEDARNLRAILIYGMSGGNPGTVSAVLERAAPEGTDRTLADGITHYLRGELGMAMRTLETVDPGTLPTDIGAFVALVKGSIISQEDPKTAARLFDLARLLGPGTLVEEAALRRSLTPSAEIGDVGRFMRAVSLYVRRYLRSPYATQFADSLVKAIVRLDTALDFPTIEKMVAEMSVEHQKVIYLRLARTAAIEGLHELSDFASLKASEFETAATGAVDARARLYASLASVTSDSAAEALDKLRSIDVRKLTPADRQLLDAALSIAASVVERPTAAVLGGAADALPDEQPAPLPEQVAAPAAAPQAPGAPPRLAETGQAAPTQAEPRRLPAARDATPALDDPDALAMSKANAIIDSTKARLVEIDRLLEQKQ